MAIIILIGFFMSLFFFSLLLGKKNKALFDYVFLAMFVVYTITSGGSYLELFNMDNNYPYPHLMNFAWLLLLLHGPLLWFYVKALTIPDFKIKSIYLLHFVPFIIYSILHSFNFISLTAEEKIIIVKSGEHATSVFAKFGSLAIGISSIGYNIIALFLLRQHNRNIKNTFSNIENKELKWLKTLVIASLVIFSINVLFYNLNNLIGFANSYTRVQIAYSFLTGYIFYIGFFGVKQGRVFMDNPLSEIKQPQLTNQADERQYQEKNYSQIISKLLVHMERDQPYLDPEINLSKLCNLLDIKPEVLSAVLNSNLNQNFFDFINKYRTEDFKTKCLSQENKHLSILGIAYNCGFNSKAAFYRAFNKFEGMSPTAYISMSQKK